MESLGLNLWQMEEGERVAEDKKINKCIMQTGNQLPLGELKQKKNGFISTYNYYKLQEISDHICTGWDHSAL